MGSQRVGHNWATKKQQIGAASDTCFWKVHRILLVLREAGEVKPLSPLPLLGMLLFQNNCSFAQGLKLKVWEGRCSVVRLVSVTPWLSQRCCPTMTRPPPWTSDVHPSPPWSTPGSLSKVLRAAFLLAFLWIWYLNIIQNDDHLNKSS